MKLMEPSPFMLTFDINILMLSVLTSYNLTPCWNGTLVMLDVLLIKSPSRPFQAELYRYIATTEPGVKGQLHHHFFHIMGT